MGFQHLPTASAKFDPDSAEFDRSWPELGQIGTHSKFRALVPERVRNFGTGTRKPNAWMCAMNHASVPGSGGRRHRFGKARAHRQRHCKAPPVKVRESRSPRSQPTLGARFPKMFHIPRLWSAAADDPPASMSERECALGGAAPPQDSPTPTPPLCSPPAPTPPSPGTPRPAPPAAPPAL